MTTGVKLSPTAEYSARFVVKIAGWLNSVSRSLFFGTLALQCEQVVAEN